MQRRLASCPHVRMAQQRLGGGGKRYLCELQTCPLYYLQTLCFPPSVFHLFTCEAHGGNEYRNFRLQGGSCVADRAEYRPSPSMMMVTTSAVSNQIHVCVCVCVCAEGREKACVWVTCADYFSWVDAGRTRHTSLVKLPTVIPAHSMELLAPFLPRAEQQP
jgi:hypothetical protein